VQACNLSKHYKESMEGWPSRINHSLAW